LRHYATSRMVAGSIPGRVTGIFLLISSFQPHYDSGVIQLLTQMRTRGVFLRGKKRLVFRVDNLATLKCRLSINSWGVKFLEP